MSDEKQGWKLKEHEKFWAFVFLVVVIVVLVIIAANFARVSTANDIVTQGKLRIIDSSIAGLLTIAGMAAQALFRVGSTEAKTAETLSNAVDKLPPPTGEAKPDHTTTLELTTADQLIDQGAAPWTK